MCCALVREGNLGRYSPTSIVAASLDWSQTLVLVASAILMNCVESWRILWRLLEEDVQAAARGVG